MDLGDLLSSLSEEDMRQLRETASNLLGNMQTDSASENKIAETFDNPLADPRILSGLSKYFGKMNEKDSRCDFLYALKPLLQQERQARIEDAVNLLKVTRMISILKEGNILG